MRVIRIGLPGLIGAVLVYIALQSTLTSLGDPAGSTISAFRNGLVPAAIGVALLLAALAISRGSRAGFLLGLAVASLMVVAGGALVVFELPYLQAGGEGAAFGGGFVVVAVIWSILWVGYGVSVWRARSTFVAGWQPDDRRFGIVLAGVAVFSTGAYLGLGAVQDSATSNSTLDDAQAPALVEATAFQVRAVDSIVTSGTDGAPVVNHMTLEIELRSPQGYRLATGPTLCLTSQAIYLDPAYKPGMLCWAEPGLDDALRSQFAAIRPGVTTTTLQVDGTGSPCPFPPGQWNAELTLAPSIDNAGGGVGPAPGLYSLDAMFQVGEASVAPPTSGATAASEGCIGVSP
jgi:hypothetical protein